MIKIDGSYLEGGGQILRTSLALSTLLQQPVEINDIRKGRQNPGLSHQHLHSVKALATLSNGAVEGAAFGSQKIIFIPGQIKGRTLSVNIETAGSITLLLQALLIPSIFSGEKIRLKITGGTDVKWSQPFDYFNLVFIPQLKKYADIEVKLLSRGYYPKGNGKVDITIKPKYTLKTLTEAPKINLVGQGKLFLIKGVSHASRDLEKAEVAERQARAAKLQLNSLNIPVKIESIYSNTLSTGSGITVAALFSKTDELDEINPVILGADALGEKTKRSEEVGKEAAEKLLQQIKTKAAVDEHLADNLIPFLGLCSGTIKVANITNHTLTNIYVTEQFLGKIFEVNRKENLISASKKQSF